jgi:hypothetical protein
VVLVDPLDLSSITIPRLASRISHALAARETGGVVEAVNGEADELPFGASPFARRGQSNAARSVLQIQRLAVSSRAPRGRSASQHVRAKTFAKVRAASPDVRATCSIDRPMDPPSSRISVTDDLTLKRCRSEKVKPRERQPSSARSAA